MATLFGCVNLFDRHGSIIIGYFQVNVGIAAFRMQIVTDAGWVMNVNDIRSYLKINQFYLKIKLDITS
jgi:hypothetical protein